MYVRTRYDTENTALLGLRSDRPTTGYPITASGEDLMCAGEKWIARGPAMAEQVLSSWFGSASRADVDALLDRLANAGQNSISIIGIEGPSRAPGGPHAGKQVGCFDDGYPYAKVSARVWSVGDVCRTVQGGGSGRTNVYRVVSTVAPHTGTGTVGPTGTGSSIVVGNVTWGYLRPAYSVYSEAFFAGAAGAAGFDYFMDACSRRGIYVELRFNAWGLVFQGQQGGYPLAGGATQSSYSGTWAIDGEAGAPTYLTYMRGHITALLDRVNTVNGRRYGDDHTFWGIDLLNEDGLAFWYMNTPSTGTASATGNNTFDRLCAIGSASPGIADINSTVVAAYDVKFSAWYAANYAGSSPSVDFPGRLNTLPVYWYTGAMGPNVAPRNWFRELGTGTAPADSLAEYRNRVALFWQHTERDWVRALKTHVRSKSSHILVGAGQIDWMSLLGILEGDYVAHHLYETDPFYSTGNTLSLTGTMGAYSGGTVSVSALSATDTAHPLVAGQFVRVTQVAAPFASDIYVIAGNTGNTAFTATLKATATGTTAATDPGYTGAVNVLLPNVNMNRCPWHKEPPDSNVADSTRTHVVMADGGGERDYDTASWKGQSNYGNIENVLRAFYFGKPHVVSELGIRGLSDPEISGTFQSSYDLLDKLQGGSGSHRWCLIHGFPQTGAAEQSLVGDGSALLAMELSALLARPGLIAPLPQTDITEVTLADITAWVAGHNATEGFAGISCTWRNMTQVVGALGINQSWNAFLHRRLRLKLSAATAKTNNAFAFTSTGQTYGDLTDPSTGRLFHNRHMGYLTYENAKVCAIFGRIPAVTSQPADSATLYDFSKLKLSCSDGKNWYGQAFLVSADGSDLGVGRAHLYTWMYPREEVGRFRRFSMTGRVKAIEMLDGDIAGSTDAAIQPGLVLRNGLEVRLTSPRPMSGYRHARGVVDKLFGNWAYTGTEVVFGPRCPRTVLI